MTRAPSRPALRLALAALAGIGVAAAGCGRRPPNARVAEAAPDSARAEAAAAADSLAARPVARPGALPRIGQLGPGYRVELHRSPSLREAEAFRDRVRPLLDQPVYVEYENPFYRVRAGDYETREGAEAWRSRQSGPDFERTEVVRTLIVSR